MADAGAYLTREDAQAMADEGSYDTERALASVLAMHDEIDRLRDAVWTYLREAYPVGTEHPVDLDADLLRERSGISMDYWCEQCPTATESTGPTEGATVADIDAYGPRYESVAVGSIMRTFRCIPCDHVVTENLIPLHDAAAHPAVTGPSQEADDDSNA